MTRDYFSIPNPVLIVLEYLPYGGLLGTGVRAEELWILLTHE